jgi:hypothetical protein
MKSGFGRTDNWHKGLVFDFSPLFWSGSVEYRPKAAKPLSKRQQQQSSLVLLTVLASKPPGRVVTDELTTMAFAFTSARFIHGNSIFGNPLGLAVAAFRPKLHSARNSSSAM